MDRRTWLGGALAGGFAAAGIGDALAAETGNGWFARKHLPIGLQLYTVADAAKQDLDGTLAQIAKIGFRTIELAGYHGHSVADLRAAALRHSLKFTSIHVGAVGRPGEPGLDQDLPRLAADLHVLGVTDVILPMFPIPDRLGAQKQGEGFLAYLQRISTGLTRDDWQRTAALLNDRGKKLRELGLRFGYHNHNPEFAPVGGTTGLAVLLAESSPEDVTFELDVGWAAAAQVDLMELLLHHTRRFQLMHVKDIRASTKKNYALQQDPIEVGAGSIPWKKILPVAFAVGVRKFYVEQEPPFTTDRFTAIGKSYQYLQAFDA
ncbi:MAG: sugar phosphate isomerase/epimerase [Steroidobacteraceae bacterium]